MTLTADKLLCACSTINDRVTRCRGDGEGERLGITYPAKLAGEAARLLHARYNNHIELYTHRCRAQCLTAQALHARVRAVKRGPKDRL